MLEYLFAPTVARIVTIFPSSGTTSKRPILNQTVAFVAVSVLLFSTSIHPPSTSNTRWKFMASSTPDLLEQLISGEPFFFLSTAQKTFNKKLKENNKLLCFEKCYFISVIYSYSYVTRSYHINSYLYIL